MTGPRSSRVFSIVVFVVRRKERISSDNDHVLFGLLEIAMYITYMTTVLDFAGGRKGCGGCRNAGKC